MRKKSVCRIVALVLAGVMAFSSFDATVFSKTLESDEEYKTESDTEENYFDEDSAENSTKETGTVEEEINEENNVLEESITGENCKKEESNVNENSDDEIFTEENNEAEECSIETIKTEEAEREKSVSGDSTEEIFMDENFINETSIEENSEVEDITICETEEDKVSYEIFLDANGGYLDDEYITVYNGEAYGELPVPFRDMYQFEGWFTEREEGNQITAETIVELKYDITLYARWTAKEVSAPVANIETGSWIDENTIIYLSSVTPDAEIYYTTDGTVPYYYNDSAKFYTEEGIKAEDVMCDSNDPKRPEKIIQIKAYAIKDDCFDSEIVTFEYSVETDFIRWGDITEEDRKIYATEEKPEGDSSLVPNGMWIAGIDENGYVYSGKNITFEPDTEDEIRVYDGKRLLKLNQDYTLIYKNNKNVYQLKEGDAGFNESEAPSLILTGKGNYSGSITKTFIITPLDLATVNDDGVALFKAQDVTLAYNGSVQKAVTKVIYTDESGKNISLKEDKDFSYIYPGTDANSEDYDASAFKEAREIPYVVIVEGKGNYAGTITFNQFITSAILISKAKISAIPNQEYKDGTEIEPELTIKYNGKILTKYSEETGTGDYTLRYEDNIMPGIARVIITGKGEYGGTHEVNFKINGINLKKAKMEGFQKTYIYTGDEIKQDKVKITYATATQTLELKENEHYTVNYTKNKKAGTVTVVYSGVAKKGWTGTVKKSFKIKAYDLNADTEKRIVVTDLKGNTYPQKVNYTKGGAKPVPVIKYTSPAGEEYILKEGIDYKLSYTNNKKINDGKDARKLPTIKITGKGNFAGTRQNETYYIVQSDISNLNITASDKVYKNKKGNFTTSVVITDVDGKILKSGTDYEKKYKYYYCDNVELADGTQRYANSEIPSKDIVPKGTMIKVEVVGKGAYAGNSGETSKVYGFFRVVAEDVSKATVKVDNQYYTGKEICPDKNQIVVTLKKKILDENDYEIVSYENNINKGKAKITIKGIGNYGGSKTVNFTIADKSMYCRLYFYGNGANSGNMKPMQLKAGEEYILEKNAYKKNGFVFKGWNTKADGTGTDDENNIILYPDQAKTPIKIQKSEMGKSFVLYAQWDIVNYDIVYKLNGGTNHELNPDKYTVKDEILLREPRKEGYNFLGWYTDSKFSETKRITSISKGSFGNKTLYAKWVASVIDKVEIPDKYLDVRDFGACPDDDIDDTNAIKNAIRKASGNADIGEINTVYVPAGMYIITPGDANNDGEPGINLKSNVNLVMENEAVLMVNSTSFHSYCVISAKNVENITITGGKISGERYKHKGTNGEWGHGIALYGARNVKISSVSISSNWGDGIYLGTQAVKQEDGSQKYVGCKDITISDCDIFDNRRNNISVTDADDLTIDHCYIFDAHGTAPQCGIDIEPNSNSSGDKICRNIVLKDTVISAYKNKNEPEYMCFMTHHNPYVSGFTTSDGIWFKNCTFNGFVGNYSGNNLHYDDKTVFNGTFVNMR